MIGSHRCLTIIRDELDEEVITSLTIRGVDIRLTILSPVCVRTRHGSSKDLECGWLHPDEDVERTLLDDTRDYHPIYGWPHAQFHAWATVAGAQNPVAGDDDVSGPSSAVLMMTDDRASMCRFLEDAVVIRSEEYPMTLLEVKSYVCGRMAP